MFKKFFYSIIGLVVIAGAGFYFLSSQEPPSDPAEAAPTVHAITEDFSISPVNAYDNNSIWFGHSNGRLMRYDLTSQQTTEYPIPRPEGRMFTEILWPPVGKDAIFVSAQGEKRFFHYYNDAEKKFIELPANVLDISWFGDGLRIAVIWQSGDGTIQLVTSNADGSGYKIITQLPWADLKPKVSPVNETALMVRADPDGLVNKIYLFDLVTGNYAEIVSEGLNNGAVWAPSGDKFAYTQINGNKSMVFVYDFVSQSVMPLDINAGTEKIAFSQDGFSLYAAALSADGTYEDIISVDVITGQKKTIFTLPATLRARNLVPIGQKIYFLGAPDNKLYGIE